MKTSKTTLQDCIIIYPKVFQDERGYFFESFNESSFEENGIPHSFVQDNQSCSKKGVLRGLHFQTGAFAQGKLVRVIQGKVLDVAVDLRQDSNTFGQYEFFELDGLENKMVYIPEGFAHGFLTLEDDTIFSYKCTAGYNKASEGGLIWDDPTLNIQWPDIDTIVSEKDLILPKFDTNKKYF